MADLSSVFSFAERVLNRFAAASLDLLINNAGVYALGERQVTSDGFERQFATNYIGPFALTALLFPSIKRSSRLFDQEHQEQYTAAHKVSRCSPTALSCAECRSRSAADTLCSHRSHCTGRKFLWAGWFFGNKRLSRSSQDSCSSARSYGRTTALEGIRTPHPCQLHDTLGCGFAIKKVEFVRRTFSS